MKSSQSKWDRNDKYRSDFLKTNKGLFGCIYICVYCGRPMLRKTMQVDHHLAVNHVKHNPLLKLWFGVNNTARNAMGYLVSSLTGKPYKKLSGVNVTYNLLPACPKCNREKSDKGGMWVVRGYIGGTIWKILNQINNLCIYAWHNPVIRAAIIGALAFLVLQYVLTGAGLIANIISAINSALNYFMTGVNVASGRLLTTKLL